MPQEQHQTERGNRSSELTKVRLPRKYDVFIINDDVTTFDFVEYVLVTLFGAVANAGAAMGKEVKKMFSRPILVKEILFGFLKNGGKAEIDVAGGELVVKPVNC